MKNYYAPTVIELLYRPKIIRPSNWREQITTAYFEKRNYLPCYYKSIPLKWRNLLKEQDKEIKKPSFGL